MSEEGFVAFVAPRLARRAAGSSTDGANTEIDSCARVEEASASDERVSCVADERESDEPAPSAATASAPTEDSASPPPESAEPSEDIAPTGSASAAGIAPVAPDGREPIPSLECDRAEHIRNEAIRLAVIACGRALRRAVVIHPRIIAAFVDDALVAAGRPGSARIRVHPDAVAHLSPGFDIVTDPELERSDVFIESDGASVGADLDTRAELLVRAAAQR